MSLVQNIGVVSQIFMIHSFSTFKITLFTIFFVHLSLQLY